MAWDFQVLSGRRHLILNVPQAFIFDVLTRNLLKANLTTPPKLNLGDVPAPRILTSSQPLKNLSNLKVQVKSVMIQEASEKTTTLTTIITYIYYSTNVTATRVYVLSLPLSSFYQDAI